MSSRHRSPIDVESSTVNAISASAGGSAKRPCHSALAGHPVRAARRRPLLEVRPSCAVEAGEGAQARRQHRAAVPGSATHISVSSPATVPSSPSIPLRSRADATTWAQPGGVRSTTRLPDTATSATHSPSTRRSWSTGAMRSLSMAGRAYTVWPPAARTLMTPSSSRSRDTVACVVRTPSCRQQLEQLGLVADRLLADQPGDRLLAPLLHAHGRDPDQERQRAAGGVETVVALLEHPAARPVDHAGRDLESAVRRQAVHEHRLRGGARPSARRRP